jgi:type II secretory pathway pseudopilin PulG
MGTIGRSQGFSLFELVVFIVCVAIIYAAAARRFSGFTGEAERANFLAITIELQTAVNLEVMMGANLGRYASIEAFSGANPMDLLLAPPMNYLGAFDSVDSTQFPRRVWYFDKTTEELVYLVNDNEDLSVSVGGVDVTADEIRFKMQIEYRYEDTLTGLPIEVVRNRDSIPEENLRQRFSGILMRPTYPFNWAGSDPNSLIAEAQALAPG